MLRRSSGSPNIARVSKGSRFLRRRSVASLLASLLIILSATSARPAEVALERKAKKRPNVVLIVADDLGWADTGAYGSRFHRTPNINRLARSGVRFTDFYAAAPVCSPSRAALLTGAHPARLRLTDWLPGREDSPNLKLRRPAIARGLPFAAVTLAEAFRGAGYVTALIGKWHLGGEGFEPERRGFDLNIAGDHSGTPVSYFYPYRRGSEFMPGLDEGQPGEYLTDRLTAEAERFIERNRERPFFLYLPHYAVHIPMRAKPEIVEKYRRQYPTARRSGQSPDAQAQRNPVYAAMIESLDDSVGRIVRKLRELNLGDDTIVVFTSDNGGLHVEEGPDTPATSNAPLRAGKGYLYEGGLRVPFIIRAPGVTPAGRVCRAPVSNVDLASTLARLAGVPFAPPDGRSFDSLLRDPAANVPRALYWHYPHYSNQGGKPGGAVRFGRFKLIEFFEDVSAELYDLERDPSETTNLAARAPQIVDSMRRNLRRWRARVGAQMMTPNPDYVPAGSLRP